MGMKRSPAVAVCAAALMGVSAGGALAYGPAPPPGHPENNPQLEACGRAVDRQIAMGITAGGGPKAGEPGPLNCDHFYQAPEGAGTIGNGWPPPPFQS
jgi:hypothetical protein